jgi:methylphosphotriester-DNA--protein-cysteine methyltransferase
MIRHLDISDQDLRRDLKRGQWRVGVNARLKIFGTLDCHSGKRMKRKNRVFFANAAEARAAGYRPCGNSMKEAYQAWTCSNP